MPVRPAESTAGTARWTRPYAENGGEFWQKFLLAMHRLGWVWVPNQVPGAPSFFDGILRSWSQGAGGASRSHPEIANGRVGRRARQVRSSENLLLTPFSFSDPGSGCNSKTSWIF